MKNEIPSPPRTIMEVYKMLPEGTLAELIDGQIYMSPAPTNKHQRICRDVAFRLMEFVEANFAGEIFFAPMDIYLDDQKNAVQPDVIFISKENINQPLDEVPFHGTPDLLVEILSVGNNTPDLVTKKNLYEKFGVKEYWIIDPTNKETTIYFLKEKSYQMMSREIGKATSALLNHTFIF